MTIDSTGSLERSFTRRERRLRWMYHHVLAGPAHPVYRALVVAWTIAILARATLAQVSGTGWWTAQILLFTGAALLLRWGGRLGWFISLLGLLVPLLFLRCWMTQTTLLAAIATVGLLTTRAGSATPTEDESDETRGLHAPSDVSPESDAQSGTLEASARDLDDVNTSPAGPEPMARAENTGRRVDTPPPVVPFAGALVICTYLVAVFHKLNHDFFDGEISCAVYGWAKLDRLTPNLPLPELWPVLLQGAVLGTELLIAWLLLRRSLRAALVVGALFHLPLTIALAPAFVFTMGIGYAARMRSADVTAFREAVRRHGVVALAVGVAAAGAVTWTAGVWPIWHLLVKIVLLVGVAWVALRMGAAPRPDGHGSDHVSAASCGVGERAERMRRSPWALAAVGLMVALASTPYLGTRVQHAGAMLSNLRIDEGCWNHFVVPEWVRRGDPYVRVELARVGGEGYRARGLHERREAALLGGLWGDDALRAVRRNWCRPHTRPIRIEGTLRGEGFVIEDLCAEEVVLPEARGTLGGRAWFPGHLRFQTTLARECRQVCVH